MSGWLLAMREVYDAGGVTTAARMHSSLADIETARTKGVIARSGALGGAGPHVVQLSPRGRALCEGKLEFYVPPYTSTTGGRAPGTHRRLRATWLASLPEGVRLTGSEHRAQNDGTCYW